MRARVHRLVRLSVVGLSMLAVGSSTVWAALYEVTVTRIEDNFYEITDADLLIQTTSCFEYASWEDAILQWDGTYGKLIFPSTDTVCDVEDVWAKANLS